MPKDSEIITPRKGMFSGTGMQRGSHGLETRESSIAIKAEAAPDKAVEWLRRSLPSLRSDPGAREIAAVVLPAISRPAAPEWTMARVASLLSPYYEKDIPQGVRMMEAEDWAEALAEFPQWAIQGAVRWWKSDNNPDRRKRPFEGDIAARCRVELDAVAAARWHLSRPIIEQQPAREPIPEKTMAERQACANSILAQFKISKGNLQ